VQVQAYGSTSPLNSVAAISVPEPRMISVNVWDKSMVVAVEKADPGQVTDPEFLEAIRTKATAITIREGESRTVDLKITAVP